MDLGRIASRIAILFQPKISDNPLDLLDDEYHIWQWDMESLCAEARGKECTADEVKEYIDETIQYSAEYEYRMIFKYKGKFFAADFETNNPPSFGPNDVYLIDSAEIMNTASDHFNELIEKGMTDWDDSEKDNLDWIINTNQQHPRLPSWSSP